MSTASQTKDVYTILKQSTEKYFANVEKATNQFIDGVNDLQEECMAAWENVVLSTISVQQQCANKTGTKISSPDPINKIVNTTNEQITKALDVQSQINLATINTARQNIKTFNDNASTFTEINQNIVNAWASWTPQRN